MGGWSNLFFEDQTTWTSTVAEVCSTIINYGVDIPWCVCHKSWNVINFFTENLTLGANFVSNVLRLDDWWCFEYTVILLATLMNIPIIKKRSKGDCYLAISQLFILLTMLSFLGCFMETTVGLQNGLVFGGKLFFPSLALFGIVCQGIKIILSVAEKDIYGFGYTDDSKKDARVLKVINVYKKTLSYESLFFLAIATFGLPKFEANTDLNTWLSVLPFLAFWKEIKEFFDAEEPEREAKDKNGDVVSKAKASDDKAVADKSQDAKKEDSADEKKTASLLQVLCGSLESIYGLAIKPVVNLVACLYSRVMNLPWELIGNLILKYGCLFTYTWTFWKLTEDLWVLGFPLATYVAPMTINKFVVGKVDKQGETFLRELCLVGMAGLQYYLFKSNIVHY